GAKGLDERPPLLVPALGLDRLTDLVTRPLPATGRRPAQGLVGQLQAAVDRHPAHGLRVHEVAALAPHLPDPGVGLLPSLGGGVDQAEEEAPVVVVRRAASLVPAPRQLQEIAVHVQLELFGGGVADAYGRRPSVALEMIELELGQTALAADAEHDLEVLGAARR